MSKLNIVNDISWSEHRSGWNYVLSLLMSQYQAKGIIVDGCIDATFGYQEVLSKSKQIPYVEDWVGFLHHPINICPWYYQDNLSPQYVIKCEAFQNSLPCCKGIFTLSEHLAVYLRRMTNYSIEVQSLFHPTEKPALTFDLENFRGERKVSQVGSWMRNLTSIFKLRAEGYDKYMPLTRLSKAYLNKEIGFLNNLIWDELNSTIIINYLSNTDYDELLSESIVFLDLYDSSANNTIIECIVRNTPILVNKIPPVIEYLGKDYPFFYENLQEAEEMLYNDNLIKITHEYLKEYLPKGRLNGSSFLENFHNSNIFKSDKLSY